MYATSHTALSSRTDAGEWPSHPLGDPRAGMALATFQAAKASEVGDSRITILRVDPNLWELTVVGLSQTGEASGLTAREWSRRYDLVAAINAGIGQAARADSLGATRQEVE